VADEPGSPRSSADRLTKLVSYLRSGTARRIPIRRSTLILAVAFAGALTLHVLYPHTKPVTTNTSRPTTTTAATRSLPASPLRASFRPGPSGRPGTTGTPQG
jgi:hypothetical protein